MVLMNRLESRLLKRRALKYDLLLSALINGWLFFMLFSLCKPLYRNPEDFFSVYLLGGGFGNAPTDLLHINHMFNPVLMHWIKTLFLYNPRVNWYSGMLIFFHFISCTLILVKILRRKRTLTSLLVYLLFFVVAEAMFLLYLNVITTAIILTIASLSILIPFPPSIFNYRVYLAVILLLFASFLRIYVIIPLAGITLPFLFSSFNRKHVVSSISFVIISVSFICFFNQVQQYYYKKHIPNWEREEQYRQMLYKFSNSPSLFDFSSEKWHTEQAFIKNGLILDTNFLTFSKLESLYNDLSSQKDKSGVSSVKGVGYWMFINNRIFLASLLFFLFFYAGNKNKWQIVVSLMLLLAGAVFLLVYAKLPWYLPVSCIGLLGLLTFISSDKNKIRAPILFYLLSMIIIAWGGIRMYKMNKVNLEGNARFLAACKEIQTQKDKLFIVMDDKFLTNYFSVFDSPSKIDLKNIILFDHYHSNLAQGIMQKFGINSIQQIPFSKNVLVWGKPFPEFMQYYNGAYNIDVDFSPVINNGKYGEVRALVVKP